MRTTLCTLIIAAAGSAASAQITHTYNFDDIAPGAEANTTGAPTALGMSFLYGVYEPDTDEFGDPIPGTERWRPDTLAPDVIVDDPSTYGRGNAPSGVNALDALFQPVLLSFSTPFNFLADGFRLTLDNDSFGDNGNLPGFEDISVQFYSADGTRLGLVPVNQTQPGFQVATGGFQEVSYVYLPAGAFYDDIFVSGRPIPAPASLALLGLAGFAGRRRR